MQSSAQLSSTHSTSASSLLSGPLSTLGTEKPRSLSMPAVPRMRGMSFSRKKSVTLDVVLAHEEVRGRRMRSYLCL